MYHKKLCVSTLLTLQKKHYLKKVMTLLFRAFSLEQLSAFYIWAGLVIFHYKKTPLFFTKDKFGQISRENTQKCYGTCYMRTPLFVVVKQQVFLV